MEKQLSSAKSVSRQAASSFLTTMQAALKANAVGITDAQSAALLEDITSLDSVRQVDGLIGVFTLLSAGKDVGLHVSIACRRALTSSNTVGKVKCMIYDLVRATSLTDSDWECVVASIKNDFGSRNPVDVRAKSLKTMSLLPPHHLDTLLANKDVSQKLLSAFNSPSDAVKVALIESMSELTPLVKNGPFLAEGWRMICQLLVDDSDLVAATACVAFTRLFSDSDKKSRMVQYVITVSQEHLSVAFSGAFARLCKLSSMLVVCVPPMLVSYLKSLQPTPEERPLDSLAGDFGSSQSADYALEESVAFLADMLKSVNPAAILAAADALIELAQLDAACAVVQAALPRAVSSLLAAAGATDHGRPPAAQPAVLATLLRGLPSLPRVQQALLFRKLPALIASVPAGRDRTWALVQVWSSTLYFDWTTNALSGVVPQSQQILQDAVVKEFIAGGSLGAKGSTQSMRDPAFREELVSSLLYVLLMHSRGNASLTTAPVAASNVVAAASKLQSLTERVQWLESCKVSLIHTKACLGWDRVTGLKTTGTTAVVDIWLQLLLRCVKAVTLLQDAATNELEVLVTGTESPAESSHHVNAVKAFKHRIGSVETEFQGLLLQIVTNWKALHPVAKARAIWICTFHLTLKSCLDAGWTSLVDGVRGLFCSTQKIDGNNNMAAVAQGLLVAKDTESSQNVHAAALAASASEHSEIALLCLERLTSLLAYNHKKKLRGRLSAVGGLLEKVIKLQLETELSRPHKERLHQLKAVIGPIASAGINTVTKDKVRPFGAVSLAPAVGQAVPGTDDSAPTKEKPMVVDLVPNPVSPASAAYPTTFAVAGALSQSWESKRYRTLLEQLQSAVWRAEGGGDAFKSTPSGLPSLLQLSELLLEDDDDDVRDGASPSLTKTIAMGATLVTGPATPLALKLRHSVDRRRGCLYLHCTLTNCTTESLTGVGVELTLGGPLAHGHRRPLFRAIKSVPAADTVSWDTVLRVNGFGWPVVQPKIILPATIPGGDPIMRCRPYHISPLELLAPPRRSATVSEFYQRWQALPHRARIAGRVLLQGSKGTRKVLEAIESQEGMSCVYRSVSPLFGAAHAAYHGLSWEGDSIAFIVTGADDCVGQLVFHFGSETSDVVSRIQAHQAELLEQLTNGYVAPWADSDLGITAIETAQDEAAPQRPPGTFSFFRFDDKPDEQEVEAEEPEEDIENEPEEPYVLEKTVLFEWQKIRRTVLL